MTLKEVVDNFMNLRDQGYGDLEVLTLSSISGARNVVYQISVEDEHPNGHDAKYIQIEIGD